MRLTILTFAAALALVVPTTAAEPPAAAKTAAATEWTGFVTDTHCGAKGASRDHTTACLDKCVKSGSKAQILDEVDKKIYDLDAPDRVRELVGKRVTVKGKLDAGTGVITVASAAAAPEKK